ncbi:hypothetical protein [Pimelobacter sp. 30-1]|uniref:hypothetical protein n=1 Tax=Pimelobacter sp. 30-1 TaxID=2004991 RepID=UPI001C04CFEC|nr:hypothetical protein [Pimelobacter sp. 30-1]
MSSWRSISGAPPSRPRTIESSGSTGPGDRRGRLRRDRRRLVSEREIKRLSTYLRRMAEKRNSSMNRYGLLAQAHWRTHAPTRYAALEDPAAYFTTLGETVAAQVASTQDRLEQGLPAELEYLDRVAQLRTLQRQAEELVLTDLVYSVTAEPSSRAEELETLLGLLPSPAMLEEQLARLTAEATEEAEREGWSQPLLSEEQEEQQDRLLALLQLVRLDRDPAQMSEAELSERIQALAPFLPPESAATEA